MINQLPKKGAAKKWSERLKKVGEKAPPEDLMKILNDVSEERFDERNEIISNLQNEIDTLKADLKIAVNSLKCIRDYDTGPPYAYCVGFLQEIARGVLKRIEGEK